MVWKSPLWLVHLLRHWMRRQGVDLSRPEDLLGYLYNKPKSFFQTRKTRMWMKSTLIWRGGILMRRWWGNLDFLTSSYSYGKMFHMTFLDASGFISQKTPFHTRPCSVSKVPEMSSEHFIPYSYSVVLVVVIYLRVVSFVASSWSYYLTSWFFSGVKTV